MELLINVLIWMVIFAAVAWGLYWVCTKFFPSFPPALWICGLLLLIFILIFISRVTGGAGDSLFIYRTH